VKTAGILLAMAIIGLALFARPSRGGDYHAKTTLVCSDCHVMHYSQTHTYGGAPGQNFPTLVGGPNAFLLRRPRDSSQICLACHDGRTDAPDVRGANSAGTFFRAAGQLNVLGDGAAVEGTGHTIGSPAPAPGGGTPWNGNATTGLLCSHCHATHGNTYYRNLVTNPGTATGITMTYMTGTTYDNISTIQQSAKTPLTDHYKVENIRYRRTTSGLSLWCRGCHDYTTNFGHPYDTDIPNSDVTTRWFESHASRVPVVSTNQTIPGTDNRVFCLSCHKAHGSTNTQGQLWDDRTTTALEDGLSINDTCNQCHNM
jgi:hypothetical protein